MGWLGWLLLIGTAVCVGILTHLLYSGKEGTFHCIGCGECIRTGECVLKKNAKKKDDARGTSPP